MKHIVRVTAAAFLLLSVMSAQAAMLAPGAAVPAFKLKDHSGAEVSSSDLAGRTYLLWFYPKAQTPGCTTEARSLRDVHQRFATAGVQVLGVSVDPPADNKAFVEAEGLPFRLLSDTDRQFALAVGAVDSPTEGKAKRISYLVGPDGKVIRAYDNVNPETHADQVLADIGNSAAAKPATP